MKTWSSRGGEELGRPVRGWQIGLVLTLSLLPLALTPASPSVDFLGHVLRYHVLATGGSDALAASYRPAWGLLPNLGLDLVGVALLSVLPPLAGGMLVAVIVAVVPFAGILALARALNARIELHQLLLAAILVHSHIHVWGFSNFLFGLGLGFLALALWVGQAGRPLRQLATAVAVAPLLLLSHAFAFAIWGFLLAMLELGTAIREQATSPEALIRRAARLALVAALPVLLFTLSRTAGAADGAVGSLDRLAAYGASGTLPQRLLQEAVARIDSLLRVGDSTFVEADRVLGVLLWGGLAVALARGLLRLDGRLWPAVVGVTVLFVGLPPSLFGVGYVDDRLPFVLLALVAAGTTLGAAAPHASHLLLGLGTFVVVRLMLVAGGHAEAGLLFRDFTTRVAGLDTGEIAMALPLAGAGRDGTLPFCAPLPVLLAFQNGTAVPTWAYASQQPIAMQGPLAEAMARRRNLARSRPHGARESVADLFAAGFDSVIVCTTERRVPTPPGTRLIAEGPGWRLYRRPPPGP